MTKDYPGYLTTEKTVNLVARVNGTLQSTSYVAGGRVKQGQLLFVIEPTLYKDQVEQAEAELKTARAKVISFPMVVNFVFNNLPQFSQTQPAINT